MFWVSPVSRSFRCNTRRAYKRAVCLSNRLAQRDRTFHMLRNVRGIYCTLNHTRCNCCTEYTKYTQSESCVTCKRMVLICTYTDNIAPKTVYMTVYTLIRSRSNPHCSKCVMSLVPKTGGHFSLSAFLKRATSLHILRKRKPSEYTHLIKHHASHLAHCALSLLELFLFFVSFIIRGKLMPAQGTRAVLFQPRCDARFMEFMLTG